MRTGLGVGAAKFGQIWARAGTGGQVWMGQTDRTGMGEMVSGWGLCICRSKGGCGWVWVGKFGEI